jgi:hypothetical protein
MYHVGYIDHACLNDAAHIYEVKFVDWDIVVVASIIEHFYHLERV